MTITSICKNFYLKYFHPISKLTPDIPWLMFLPMLKPPGSRHIGNIYPPPPKIHISPEKGPSYKEINHLPTIHFQRICLFSADMYYQQFMFYLKFQLNLLFHPGLNPLVFHVSSPPIAIANKKMDVSENSGIPTSSILISFSIINPSILGYIYIYIPIFETTHIFVETKPQRWRRCRRFWRCSKSFWRPPGSPGPFRASLPFAARRHGVNNPATDPLRSPSPYRSIHELVDLFCSL